MNREIETTSVNDLPVRPDNYVRRWLWLLTAAGVAAPALLTFLFFSIAEVNSTGATLMAVAAVSVIVTVILVNLTAQARVAEPLKKQDRVLATLRDQLESLKRDANDRENPNSPQNEPAETRDALIASLDELLSETVRAIAAEAQTLRDSARDVAKAAGQIGRAHV